MSYYDMLQNVNKKPEGPGRHSKRLITLDESVDNQQQMPNIFSDEKTIPQENNTDIKKGLSNKKQSNAKFSVIQLSTQPKNKKQNSSKLEPIIKSSNLKQIKQKNKNKAGKQLTQGKMTKQKKQKLQLNQKIQKQQKKIEIIEVPQFDQLSNEENQVHGVSKKSWLSLSQSFSLSLGHFFYSYNFPIRRQIPIIANNLDLQREKYQNGTYISESFDNNLQVSFLLFFLKTVLMENFLRLSFILWVAAVILSFIIGSNQQYKPGKQILLGIFVFYCVATVILQFLSLKNRRSWQQSSKQIKYKVYHYDNQTRTAQWVLTDVSDLRPGNIYKIPPPTISKPSVIPADSILLHGPRTILQVDDSSIIEYLSPLQKQERICLKQTLIKQQLIMLPLTGVIHYQLTAPQIVQQNIYGKFIIQQPRQQTINITYNNVMLRGTCILSSQMILTDDSNKKTQQKQSQMLAVVLQTGIDSLVLKTSQYPYQYRKQYTYVKIIDLLLIVCSILYLLLVGSGILIGYIYLANKSINRGYYIDNYLNLGETPVTLTQIVLQHLASLIMVVPILLRVSYLFYVNIAGRIVGKKLNIQMKDVNMLNQARETEILVTTIGGDLIRMGDNKYSNKLQEDDTNIFDISNQNNKTKIRNRSLQSIRVGGIHHNFITSRIDTQLYSVKDIDMMCYFMSIALLTCNRRNPSPLEGGIIQRAQKQFNIKIQKTNNVIKIDKLKVIKIFTIPATQKYPYKVLFYRHASSFVEEVEDQSSLKIESKEKILGLVRGQTTKLTQKMSQFDGSLLSQFSNRLHQQKGFHIQLLGKFVISYQDFLEVKRSYLNKQNKKKDASYSQQQRPGSNISLVGISKFYEELQSHMRKVDPMGLLIWQNPYSILSNNLLPISSLPQLQYKIIIAPASKSETNPQFESIHTITNYLLKTSKLALKQISNKILHNYSDKQTFWAMLKNQKIVILNGWNYGMIKKLLIDLKQLKRANKKQIKLLGYIQQDQYAWVLKQTDVSISSKGDGYDLQKYSDFLINQDLSSTTTDVIKRLFIYAQAHNYCIQSIIIIQLMKSVLLATVQFINHFYTWGTSLTIIATPLYLILQVGILLDFLYYLFPRLDQDVWALAGSQIQTNKKQKANKQQENNKISYKSTISAESVVIEILIGFAIGAFLTFIPVYSMTQPPTKYGTIQSKEFTNILIHFILYHALVFRKIFMKPYTFSLYKLFIILVQLGVYYLGLLIVSAIDFYQYKGIIWYIFQAKIIIVSVFCVWMITGIYWLYFMLQNIIFPKPKIMKNNYAKLPKKVQELSMEQQSIKVGEAVDIQ